MFTTKMPLPIRRAGLVATAALVVAAVGAPSAGAEITSTSECANPVLTQPFLSSKDSNNYMLVPGQDNAGFNGSGWTVSGGARVLASGGKNVLDLPSGSTAVSPTVCVTTEYPRARMMVRNAIGAEGVFFYVSYANTPTWNKPKNTGQVHGEGTATTLSDPVNLQPPATSGWQLARFTLVPGGKSSDFQISEFWVDPFARR
jgi:hypothetical protein